ncbi:hypothetical protein SELMODRAFT_406013 [Selaginella moellendorffii]|uniref:Uncharacterized protein n=1 Tax=Selaginella moellendorffii TaxID=88036 RepID=D8R0D6_SELML|nr:hypothetical protein SELMODRAFT_406013 [Selaginella moellendorffii]
MVMESAGADETTFACVLAAHAHGGNLQSAVRCLRAMSVDHGWRPKKQQYGCVIGVLGRAGYLADARDLMESMPLEPDLHDWVGLLGACRIHGNKELAASIAQNAVRLGPGWTSRFTCSCTTRRELVPELSIQCFSPLTQPQTCGSDPRTLELTQSRKVDNTGIAVSARKQGASIIFSELSLSTMRKTCNELQTWLQHPLPSRLPIDRAVINIDNSSSVRASPDVLGKEKEHAGNVLVQFQRASGASDQDWIGVFSPPVFNSSVCVVKTRIPAWGPYICSAPIKFQYANQSQDYVSSGSGQLTFRLINQRANFSFDLFSGFAEPVLIAVSNVVTFDNLKMPLYPRLAQGRAWNEAYDDKYSFVAHPATTLSVSRGDSCFEGAPASTIGWRDPGQSHTGIMTDLWPTTRDSFQVLQDASFVMSPKMYFHSPPFPGQESLQRVVIFGDMGTHQRDGSRMYFDLEPGSLNTTDTLNNEINDIDIIFHIGDISYATGYLSEWDQFTEQIENLSSKVPYITASTDSGGECGVVSPTVFNMPVQNRDKFWYKTDYGLFHFCIADSEHDWRDGTEQYEFLENCFRSADRQKQPWLVFISHRVLGYSSCYHHRREGQLGEAVAKQVPASDEKDFYSGTFNGTIHVVAGGGGFWLSQFPESKPSWSLNQDCDFGYTKLTSFNRSSLLFEYKKSRDGEVYDQFWIHREYKDVLGCDSLSMFCPLVTSAENYPA